MNCLVDMEMKHWDDLLHCLLPSNFWTLAGILGLQFVLWGSNRLWSFMIILLLWWRHAVGDIVQQSMYLLHIGSRCLNEDNSLGMRITLLVIVKVALNIYCIYPQKLHSEYLVLISLNYCLNISWNTELSVIFWITILKKSIVLSGRWPKISFYLKSRIE